MFALSQDMHIKVIPLDATLSVTQDGCIVQPDEKLSWTLNQNWTYIQLELHRKGYTWEYVNTRSIFK